MYYGLNIDDKKKALFEFLGIVPITYEIRRLIIDIDPSTVDMLRKFDYVRYSKEKFMFYSKEYLEIVDLDEFIKETARYHR
jgi:hypothetical protein